VEVSDWYIEKGLEETGAVNIVAGMILDYRAFDTLGESHVLFAALLCVMILLKKDKKIMESQVDDYYQIEQDAYFDVSKDTVMRKVGVLIIPCILVFGIYILLNGQNGPGGGFSGGAVLGAGLIIFESAFGFELVDSFFTAKVSMAISFVSLAFYSFAKGYVFFMGANHLHNHIPKGIPGAILSGGLILPLNIAVGLVVACTMFGFYSLFKRGSVGGV
jgi:multicomponent Na+:H+ antiporter subunit B